MTLTTAIAGWLSRQQATSDIEDLGRRVSAAMRHLSHPMHPLDRAEQTENLAWYEQQMADAYAAAGRDDDLAAVTASGARLLRIIADSQYALAEGWTGDGLAPEGAEARDDWTTAQSAVFRALCLTGDPAERADLIEGRFLDAWADEARAEAGEVVLSIARCERESARPGRRPYRPRRKPVPAWAAVALWWARLIIAALLAVPAGAMAGALVTHGLPGMPGWFLRAVAIATGLIVLFWFAPGFPRKETSR